MWNLRVMLVALIISASVPHIVAYVEAVAGSFGSDVAATKVEPQVAVVCDVRNPLHPQYMDSTGKWISDLDSKSACLRDKVEVLDFCRKVYHGRNITNIVEAPRSIKIDNWCKVGHRRCKTAHSVKPYRCLGKFDGLNPQSSSCYAGRCHRVYIILYTKNLNIFQLTFSKVSESVGN